MTHAWTAEEAARDLAAVDEVLAALPGASAADRLHAVAAHFERAYGATGGPRVLAAFVRLCLYLERHAAELRERGLVDGEGRAVDRVFLETLLARLAAADGADAATVEAVPARDVPDDAVEA